MPNYTLEAETGSLGAGGGSVPTRKTCTRCGTEVNSATHFPTANVYCDACAAVVANGEPVESPKSGEGK